MVVTLFFLEIKRNLYSPPKNKDSNFSLVEKAPYRIWTDDLRLTMALLYHWVKRACFIRFMNYSLFPLWVYCIIYVHDIYIYAHNIYIVHLGAINLIYPPKVKSGQIFYFFFFFLIKIMQWIVSRPTPLVYLYWLIKTRFTWLIHVPIWHRHRFDRFSWIMWWGYSYPEPNSYKKIKKKKGKFLSFFNFLT